MLVLTAFASDLWSDVAKKFPHKLLEAPVTDTPRFRGNWKKLRNLRLETFTVDFEVGRLLKAFENRKIKSVD